MRFARKGYTLNPSYEALTPQKRESSVQRACTTSHECGQRLRPDFRRDHFHRRNSGYSRALFWAIRRPRKAHPIPPGYQRNTFSLL